MVRKKLVPPEEDDALLRKYPMKKFKCKNCSTEYFDTKLYFYGTKSDKCMWCTKFPKKVKK